MIQLPKKPSGEVLLNPKKLLIFSAPKAGKTTIASHLPGHLIIATEDGAGFSPTAVVQDVRKTALDNKTTPAGAMRLIVGALKAEYEAGFQYDYVVIDTATAMEDIANEVACSMYRRTDMGKAWDGNDITSLPRGAGYGYLREAYMAMYNSISPYAKKCLVLLAHIKRSSINKGGQELSTVDLELTGKLKTLVASDMDAIGYLYVKEGNRILSFNTDETDLATGSRLDRLSGQEFVISEKKDGKIVTHWDQIFI